MSGHEEDPDDYDVGYGKPPAHSQFKKGRSGNPAGRPKKAKPEDTSGASPIGESILDRTFTITVDGKQQPGRIEDVILGRMLQAAMQGSPQAQRDILAFTAKHRKLNPPKPPEDQAPGPRPPPTLIYSTNNSAMLVALGLTTKWYDVDRVLMSVVEPALRAMSQEQLKAFNIQKYKHFVEDPEGFALLWESLIEKPFDD